MARNLRLLRNSAAAIASRCPLFPRFFSSIQCRRFISRTPNPSSFPFTHLQNPDVTVGSAFISEQPFSVSSRYFCSNRQSSEDEETEDDDDDYEDDDDDKDGNLTQKDTVSEREYSVEEKEKEAAEIGYKVMGQLQQSDRVFKSYEPVFAVVQIGSHQFKVSNGDCIYTERLKFCDVNDKLFLNKVLMMGSKNQTIIGRPILPEAAVHAVVEEHALDAKVIIFKKKRRKNYRRTKGHRQELTKLRIVDIQGIEKPEKPPSLKTEKLSTKKVEKVPVAA